MSDQARIATHIGYLMSDLKAIDRFFREHGYHPSDVDLEENQRGFEKGFDVLAKSPCHPEAFPYLSYKEVLAFGNQEDISDSDKRFFVDVEIRNRRNCGARAHSIKVWRSNDPASSGYGKPEVTERYFQLARDHPLVFSKKDCQTMLADMVSVI